MSASSRMSGLSLGRYGLLSFLQPPLHKKAVALMHSTVRLQACATVSPTLLYDVIFYGVRIILSCCCFAQVHQSLARSDDCSPEILNYFDVEGTDVLLYELRFLSADIRPAVAAYIAQHNLPAQVPGTGALACLLLSTVLPFHTCHSFELFE